MSYDLQGSAAHEAATKALHDLDCGIEGCTEELTLGGRYGRWALAAITAAQPHLTTTTAPQRTMGSVPSDPRDDRSIFITNSRPDSRLTTDRNDPRLSHGVDQLGEHRDQAEVYLVLSEEERAKGFLRPVRRSYWHTVCGTVTTMGQALAETYARDPHFYGATYCVACGGHRPVGANGEFHWVDPDHPDRQSPTDPKVGT